MESYKDMFHNTKRSLAIGLFFIICLMIFMTSCNASEENNPVEMDDRYVNQQILLKASSIGNTFKTKDSIILELKYNSNFEITFPNDFNIQIFQYTKEGWIEIEEIPTTRIPSDDIVFSPLKYMPIVQPIFCDPDLPDDKQEYLLRVYVFGKMTVEGEVKEVAAFTEVTLHP